jgi:competence protein ComEA
MTSGERRALYFLLAVVLFGAGVRQCSARSAAPPITTDTLDLARQIDTVERLRSSAARPKRRAAKPAATTSAPAPAPTPAARIDIDRATESEIERLPQIGPALARRIVDDRTQNGAFGCAKHLDAVKGIGPALLRTLDSLVSFSGGSVRAAACP